MLARLRQRLAAIRGSSPAADRLIRTVDRYSGAQGSLLAAGLTYYAFLALFPLAAVALGITSLISEHVPSVQSDIDAQVSDYLPSDVDLHQLASAGVVVGLVGLGVLLYAGVRWLGAVRRGLTLMWGRHPRETGYLRGLLRDVISLALLGACLLASVALSVASQFAAAVTSHLFGSDSGAQQLTVRLLGLLVALLIDFGVVLALFWGLSGTGPGRGRGLVIGAIVGALGFEVLKQAATLIIGAASKNVVYGTFAVTVGLIVWIAYVSRWILIVAAWTAVGAEPSGLEVDAPVGEAEQG